MIGIICQLQIYDDELNYVFYCLTYPHLWETTTVAATEIALDKEECRHEVHSKKVLIVLANPNKIAISQAQQFYFLKFLYLEKC